MNEGIVTRVIKQVITNPLTEFIGSWYSNETNEFFIDATAFIATLDDALESARMFGQQAIFDIRNLREVYL